MRIRFFTLLLLVLIFSPSLASGAVVSAQAPYSADGLNMSGLLVYDDETTVKRPAVLIFHDAGGDFAVYGRTARALAREGYIAFAATYYEGARDRGAHNNSKLKARAQAAYDVLAAHPLTDISRIAIAGGSLGANAALLLADSGVECFFVGAVSGYSSRQVKEINVGKIKASVFRFIHGENDNEGPGGKISYWLGLTSALEKVGKDAACIAKPGVGHDPRNQKYWNELADQIRSAMPAE